MFLIQREFPRLCRGGSQSLTDPGVYAVGTRTRNGRMSDLTLPLCAWFASPASLNFGVAFKRLRKGPLEGPATVKPPPLPEDIYLSRSENWCQCDLAAPHLLGSGVCFRCKLGPSPPRRRPLLCRPAHWWGEHVGRQDLHEGCRPQRCHRADLVSALLTRCSV